MDLSRLTRGSQIIGIAGLLLFIDSFLPWFRECVDLGAFGGGKVCGSASGWHTFFSILGVLIALAMVAVIAVEASGNRLPPVGTISWGQLLLIAGGVSFACILLQLIIGYHSVSRSFGLFIGVVLAAGLAYGGFLRSRESATPRTIL